MTKNPGDCSIIMKPKKAPPKGTPWRVRFTYIDRMGQKRRADVEGLTWDECYKKAQAKQEVIRSRESGEAEADGLLLFTLLANYITSKKRIGYATRKHYDDCVRCIKKRLNHEDRLIATLKATALDAAFTVGSRMDEAAIGFLRRALEWARDTGQLTGVNPAKRLECPKYKSTERTRIPDETLATLFRFEAAWDTEERLFFALALFSAARLGELLPLQWSDVTTWPGTTIPCLVIARKVSKYGAKGGTNLKMREDGEARELTLAPLIEALLDAHRIAQHAKGYKGNLLFPTVEGKVWHPDNFRDRWYNPRLLRAGLATQTDERIKTQYVPHELRHTGLTLRDELPISPYMAEEIGHKPRTVHGDVHGRYIHLSPKARAPYAQTVANYIQQWLPGWGKSGGEASDDVA
jgi:integrase